MRSPSRVEKTDGQFVHDRHPKLFFGFEIVGRQLVLYARLLGYASQRRPFETHRGKSLACRFDDPGA